MQRISALKSNAVARHTVSSILRGTVIFLLSMLFAFSQIRGIPSPYIAVFSGILPVSYGMVSFMGAMLTYFISGDIGFSIPEITAMLVIFIVKIFVCEVLGKNLSYKGITVITSVCYTTCSFVVTFLLSPIASTFAVIVMKSVICTVITFSVSYIIEKKSASEKLCLEGAVAVTLSVFYIFIISSLCSVSVSFLNIGRIFSAFAILSFARRFRSSGALVVSALSIASFMLFSEDFVSISAILTVSAIVCGFVSEKGVMITSLSFLMINVIGAISSGMNTETAKYIADTATASGIFMLFPERILSKFLGSATLASSGDISENISGRLSFLANSIGEIRKKAEKLSEALEKKTPEENLSITVCDRVCSDCRGNMRCWENDFDKTSDSFDKAKKITYTNGEISENMLPEGFSSCYRRNAVAKEFTNAFRERNVCINTKRKFREMRGLLFEELDMTENLLSSLSKDISSFGTTDKRLSDEAKKYLIKNGATDVVSTAFTDKSGKTFISGYFTGKEPDKADFCEKISDFADADFSLPVFSYAEGLISFSMEEKPRFDIDFSVSSVSSKEGEQSGDTVKSFYDGKGNFYAVLSDGMGRGNRAAIDSIFASSSIEKLLSAGADFSSAAKLVNSAMQVKSEDESFATLDFVKIGLSGGETKIMKLGGSTAFHCSKGQIKKYSSSSFPIGIFRGVSPEEYSLKLRENDTLVFTSDGIGEETYPAVSEILRRSSKLSSDVISEKIISAQKTFSTAFSDDATVAVVRLKRN